MPLTQDRNTPMKDGDLIPVPVGTGLTFYAGAIVVALAAGYASPGKTATGLTYIGRADENVDNSAGADGAKTVLVRRGQAFKWKNDGTDPVTVAAIGKPCYIVDDETVAVNDGTGTRSAAGTVVGVDADGVWVH